MHMKSKYIHLKPDELEAYENNPDAPQWDYEYIRNKFWKQAVLPPQKEHFPGIERIQLGKLQPDTFKNPFEKQQKTYLELKAERARAKKDGTKKP